MAMPKQCNVASAGFFGGQFRGVCTETKANESEEEDEGDEKTGTVVSCPSSIDGHASRGASR